MNKKGFTLIEMLVVVLIVGILAAVALPQYFKAVEKSRSTEALSVLGSIAAAQERYRLASSANTYATTFSQFDISFTDESTGSDATGASYKTKNFAIALGANSVTATRGAGTASDGESGAYTITRYYRDGRIICSDPKETGICAAIGIPTTAGGSVAA